MGTKDTETTSPDARADDNDNNDSRRSFLAKMSITVGVALGYGLLAAEGLLFVIPKKIKPPTIKIYAGRLKQFTLGGVRTLFDLNGREILVKRDDSGLTAFSSVCPHLGCTVHWEQDKNRFFCPCHGGVFRPDGVAIAGPPADAGQRLSEFPIEVDKTSKVVYLEVKEPERGRS